MVAAPIDCSVSDLDEDQGIEQVHCSKTYRTGI